MGGWLLEYLQQQSAHPLLRYCCWTGQLSSVRGKVCSRPPSFSQIPNLGPWNCSSLHLAPWWSTGLTLVLPFSRLIPDSRMGLTLAPLGAQLVRALSRAETLRTVLAPALQRGALRSPGLKVAPTGRIEARKAVLWDGDGRRMWQVQPGGGWGRVSAGGPWALPLGLSFPPELGWSCGSLWCSEPWRGPSWTLSFGLGAVRAGDSCFEMWRIIRRGMSELRGKSKPRSLPPRPSVMN